MTRLVLALSIAALLIAAIAAGWLLAWLWRRGAPKREAGALAAMATRLRAAEAGRHAAEARVAELEAALGAGRAETEERHRGEVAALRAELAAAMDGLRHARRETAEWREAYEAFEREDRETP